MLTQLTRLKDWPFLSMVVLLLLIVATHGAFRLIEARARIREDALRRRKDVNREAAGSRPRTDRKN
jgi:hypothetical protein